MRNISEFQEGPFQNVRTQLVCSLLLGTRLMYKKLNRAPVAFSGLLYFQKLDFDPLRNTSIFLSFYWHLVFFYN